MKRPQTTRLYSSWIAVACSGTPNQSTVVQLSVRPIHCCTTWGCGRTGLQIFLCVTPWFCGSLDGSTRCVGTIDVMQRRSNARTRLLRRMPDSTACSRERRRKNITAVLKSLRMKSPQTTRPYSSAVAATCNGTPNHSTVVQLNARPIQCCTTWGLWSNRSANLSMCYAMVLRQP